MRGESILTLKKLLFPLWNLLDSLILTNFGFRIRGLFVLVWPEIDQLSLFIANNCSTSTSWLMRVLNKEDSWSRIP